jgi:hypothetical protein
MFVKKKQIDPVVAYGSIVASNHDADTKRSSTRETDYDIFNYGVDGHWINVIR